MDVTVVLLLLFWLMQLNPSDILHKSNTTGFVCFVCFFFCHCVSPKFYYNPPTTRQNLKRRNKCCWLTACHLLSQDFIKIPACRRLAMRSTLILSIINYLQQNGIILLYSFLCPCFSGSQHKLIALLVCPYGLRCEGVTEFREWRDRHAGQVSSRLDGL